jgi:hypothetical protein
LDAATTCQQEADHSSANGCATKLYGCGFELLPMSDGFSGQHVQVKARFRLVFEHQLYAYTFEKGLVPCQVAMYMFDTWSSVCLM